MKNKKLKIKNIKTVSFFSQTYFIGLLALIFLIVPLVSFAQVGTTNPTPSGTVGTTNSSRVFSIQNPLKVDSLAGLIEAFIEIFTYLVVILSVLSLIYVGLRYILARGNPEEMKKMSAWLFYIVIGLAIVIGARIIVSIVINTLGQTNVVNPGIIQSANNAVNNR